MAASALAEVLSVCGGIDNAKRKVGEEKLKQISRSPEYLQNLLNCAQACSDLQARTDDSPPAGSQAHFEGVSILFKSCLKILFLASSCKRRDIWKCHHQRNPLHFMCTLLFPSQESRLMLNKLLHPDICLQVRQLALTQLRKHIFAHPTTLDKQVCKLGPSRLRLMQHLLSTPCDIQ